MTYLNKFVQTPRRARHFTAFWSVPLIVCCCPGPSTFADARVGPGLVLMRKLGSPNAHRRNIFALGFRPLGVGRKATRSTHECTGI
ncbi:hypothetical protein BDQ94DRAFT_155900 [Aspergillus welwitschiae]|uniref:Uncharacterized protein n=1 Tax=Aspergillus welwitschiae TaxID=1341132 RepID=A0A3F3PH63_9EURO|nr:hypothetical protein BDQ94DRAFT_155900 [Aspergillus welwitschiae]RDH26177.1 hypothetical protein BDQ94DRAFT_155900 [Aspergillus welwitschiae]